MKPNWKETARYPYPGPVFYETGKYQYGLDYQMTFVRGFVETRVNGPNTAFAITTYTIEWVSGQQYGISINKHFHSPRAGQQARAWCEYMITHPISGWLPFKEQVR